MCAFKDGLELSWSYYASLFLGLSFVGDLPLTSLLKSLISQHSLAMILSLSSARDSAEDEKFSDRRAQWGVTSLKAHSFLPDR